MVSINIMRNEQNIIKLNDFEFIETCGGYPEAYDIYEDGVKIGDCRVRHGCFTVFIEGRDREIFAVNNCPGLNGSFVEHRDTYLVVAAEVIRRFNWILANPEQLSLYG